jgi:PPE-repeat protein
MRSLVFFLALFCAAALANVPGYDLSLGAEVRGGTLKVAPIVTAPAGAKLRYDVTTTRTGRSGNSNSRQSGNVTVGNDGKASLSQVAVSVTEQDRYEVQVEVYDGGRLVAAETLRHPD